MNRVVKVFELRDKGTFIPIICVEMSPSLFIGNEVYLLRRAGYVDTTRCILMTKADGGKKAEYDPYDWGDRTYHVAHLYITEHWEDLAHGTVIDVEFVLGETEAPKVSEAFERY